MRQPWKAKVQRLQRQRKVLDSKRDLEESVPQLIAAALILFVVYHVLKYLLFVAVLCIPPVMLALIAYVVAQWAIRLQVEGYLEVRLPDLLDVHFNEKGAHFSKKSRPLTDIPSIAQGINTIPAGVSALALSIAIYAMSVNAVFAQVTQDSQGFPHGFNTFVAAIISSAIVAAIILKTKKPIHAVAEEIIEQRASVLNAEIGAAPDIIPLLTQNAQLRRALSIPKDDELPRAFLADLTSSKVAIVEGKTSLAQTFSLYGERIALQNEQMQTATERIAATKRLVDQAASESNAAGNLAVLHQLDQVLRGIETLRDLLRANRFEEFSAQMEGAATELQSYRA